ncbi:hypothetical protein DNTS_007131 [Danionella cerebrum]|uniref:Uncharacterized protein n=1 Tax=Danionella cerebrum TaxID=2873325 RepID=A0A553MYA6_9TELE|nr:hypothetical protein DNTS_007131 [Danionella translucida]
MASDGSPSRDTPEKQKRKKKQKQRVEDDEEGRSSDGAEVRLDDDDDDDADEEKRLEKFAEEDIQRLTAAGHAALQSGDNHAAVKHFRSAYSYASKLGTRRVSKTCALNLGAAYVEAGNAEKGLRVLQRQGSSGRVADLQFNLGTALEALADAMEFEEAVRSLLRAGESYSSSGNPTEAALALRDAGKVMLQCGRDSSEEILNVLTNSLELSMRITHSETRGRILNTLGLLFSQMSLSSEAVECFQQALPLLSGNTQTLAVVLQNLGATHNTLGEFQKALSYHKEAAQLYGSLGRRAAQGRCFSNLGFALMELAEIEEARESYTHSLLAFKDSVCEALGAIRLQMREPEKAVVHFQEALGLLSRCQDVSSSVQERLVNKLSEALQHKLILQQRKAVAQRRHSQRLPGAAMRRPDVLIGRREMMNSGGNTHDRNQVSTEFHSEEPEKEDYSNTLPEANRNLNNTHDETDTGQQVISSQPENGPGEPSVECGKQMNGTLPLVSGTVTPPPGRHKATPPQRTLKSRFCTVM